MLSWIRNFFTSLFNILILIPKQRFIILFANFKLILRILYYSIYNLRFLRKLREFYGRNVSDRIYSVRFWIEHDRTDWNYYQTRIILTKVIKVYSFFYMIIKTCIKIFFGLLFAPLVIYYSEKKIIVFLEALEKLNEEMNKEEVRNFFTSFAWFKVYFINIIKILYPKFFIKQYPKILKITRIIFNDIIALIWNITTPLNPWYYFGGYFKKDLKRFWRFFKNQIKKELEEDKKTIEFLKNIMKKLKKWLKKQRRIISYFLFKPGYYNTICVAMIVLELRVVFYSLFIIYVLIDFCELHHWAFPWYYQAKGQFFLDTLRLMLTLNALQVYAPVFVVNVLKEDWLYKIPVLYNQSNKPKYENPRFIFYLFILRKIKILLKPLINPSLKYIKKKYYTPFMHSFYAKVTPITDNLFELCIAFCRRNYQLFYSFYLKFTSFLKTYIFLPIRNIIKHIYVFIKNVLSSLIRNILKLYRRLDYNFYVIKIDIFNYFKKMYIINKIYTWKRKYLNAFKYFNLKRFVLSKIKKN